MTTRTRRLRNTETLRRLVRETRLSPDALIYPIFVRDGKGIEEPIPSLPGQIRYSPDTLPKGINIALSAGIHSFLLFGIPKTETKDEAASSAYDENGVIQHALKNAKRAFGDDALLITDVCLCEYTTHGHCGLVRNGNGEVDSGVNGGINNGINNSINGWIDNDSTLPLLAQTALSHARSGSGMVAPSAMMDGAVAAIRRALDAEGFEGIPIMSYAAKYASAFYGPFREAAGSAPQFGDRRSYQMDYHNGREALRRIDAEISEGADIVIVKPALPCLDIISQTSTRIKVPTAAYSVSGEYAMVKAAAASGFIDEYRAMCEGAVAVFRAGADILITYFAKELAGAISKGDIG